MFANYQPAFAMGAQRDPTPAESSSGESTSPSQPAAPTVPWYFKVLPYIFTKSTVDGLSVARKGILLFGTLVLMDATTITSSGFSSAMSWWRVVLLGLVYMSYYGVAMAHTILAPLVEVVALKMKEFNQLSETMPPEGLELMRTLIASPPQFNPDGTLVHMPDINTAALPELTPEMEAQALAVTQNFLQDTMLAYKKMRSGDKNPFSHFMPEDRPQAAVIEEILDDDDVNPVDDVKPVTRSDSYSSYEDLGPVEEIVVGVPPSKSQ